MSPKNMFVSAKNLLQQIQLSLNTETRSTVVLKQKYISVYSAKKSSNTTVISTNIKIMPATSMSTKRQIKKKERQKKKRNDKQLIGCKIFNEK